MRKKCIRAITHCANKASFVALCKNLTLLSKKIFIQTGSAVEGLAVGCEEKKLRGEKSSFCCVCST